MDRKDEIGETTRFEGYFGNGIVHRGGRHMKMVKNKEGNWYLCDEGADPKKDPEEQGCWGCDKVIFTRGG